MMTPVRITFDMRTPLVVPAIDKSLDALLSWAAVQQAEFHDAPDPIAAQHDIGLARHEVDGHWCFQASYLACQWVGEAAQVHYIKRQRLQAYADAWVDGLLDKRPAFDPQRTSTKAGSYFQPIRWASSVSAYGVVSDMKRVEELLPWITHIGKLHHKDFGAVRSFGIEADVLALTKWTRRNLPVSSPFAVAHSKAVGGLVSPYWKREQHTEIMVPTN
jgi:CRISPR type IV-associated protein Csf3